MRHLVWLAGMLAAAACTAPDDSVSRGRHIFAERCASCHGAGARGDGPLAGGLPVQPPDLTGLVARNGGSFPDEAVLAQIYGEPNPFHGGTMPAFGPSLEGAQVDWTTPDGRFHEWPQALVDLVSYLDTVQR